MSSSKKFHTRLKNVATAATRRQKKGVRRVRSFCKPSGICNKLELLTIYFLSGGQNVVNNLTRKCEYVCGCLGGG